MRSTEQLLTLREAAAYLGVSYATVMRNLKRSAMDSRRIPAKKVQGQWRVSWANINAWVNQN
jgi:excisionase family DNA binding protein